MMDNETVSATHGRTGDKRPLSRRERRRRIWLLVFLLLLLLLLAFVSYAWFTDRRLPGIGDDIKGIEEIAAPEYLYSITGEGGNTLERPVGVEIANGRVYVVDFGKHRVSVFTELGRYLFSFQDIAGGKILSRPNVIAIKGSEVWVTDRLRRSVYIFNLDGKYIREFKPEEKELKNWAPFAMEFAPDGRFVVTDIGDTTRHKVHFFSTQGRLIATVGKKVPAHERNSEPEAFYFPSSVAIADEKAYISDGDNRRMQVFSLNGQFLQFVDTSGVPRGADTDSQDRLYVADALAHAVDVYDLKGKRLTKFGSQGFGPGQFNYPGFVAVNDRGRIFITDRENNQVQVWGYASVAPPVAIEKPSTPLGWAACLSPLLLLPLLLLRRKRRIVVTPDFVELLVTLEEVANVKSLKRVQLICPEKDHVFYRDRVEQDVDLGHMIEPEAYSESDVRALIDRRGVTESQAIYVAMGGRATALATQDPELRGIGLLLDVTVVDFEEFRERFMTGLRKQNDIA